MSEFVVGEKIKLETEKYGCVDGRVSKDLGNERYEVMVLDPTLKKSNKEIAFESRSLFMRKVK